MSTAENYNVAELNKGDKLNSDNCEIWNMKTNYVLKEQETLEALNVPMILPENGNIIQHVKVSKKPKFNQQGEKNVSAPMKNRNVAKLKWYNYKNKGYFARNCPEPKKVHDLMNNLHSDINVSCSAFFD